MSVLRTKSIGKLSVTVRDDEKLGRVFELTASNSYDKNTAVLHEVFDITGDMIRLRVSQTTMHKLAEFFDELNEASHSSLSGEA